MAAFDASRMIGDLSGWSTGVAQPSAPVTDLSTHVDGSTPVTGTAGSNAVASAQATKVLHASAAIVLVAIALLWLSGTLVFKGARLP